MAWVGGVGSGLTLAPVLLALGGQLERHPYPSINTSILVVKPRPPSQISKHNLLVTRQAAEARPRGGLCQVPTPCYSEVLQHKAHWFQEPQEAALAPGTEGSQCQVRRANYSAGESKAGLCLIPGATLWSLCAPPLVVCCLSCVLTS